VRPPCNSKQNPSVNVWMDESLDRGRRRTKKEADDDDERRRRKRRVGASTFLLLAFLTGDHSYFASLFAAYTFFHLILSVVLCVHTPRANPKMSLSAAAAAAAAAGRRRRYVHLFFKSRFGVYVHV